MSSSFKESDIWVAGTLFPREGWITRENMHFLQLLDNLMDWKRLRKE